MTAHPALLHYNPEGFGIDLEVQCCATCESAKVSVHRKKWTNLERGTTNEVPRACPAGPEEVAVWRNDPLWGPVGMSHPIITEDSEARLYPTTKSSRER
jgi:hypothetical protein